MMHGLTNVKLCYESSYFTPDAFGLQTGIYFANKKTTNKKFDRLSDTAMSAGLSS
jgi:hypothetical protein